MTTCNHRWAEPHGLFRVYYDIISSMDSSIRDWARQCSECGVVSVRAGDGSWHIPGQPHSSNERGGQDEKILH
jgi:hypothetical protein